MAEGAQIACKLVDIGQSFVAVGVELFDDPRHRKLVVASCDDLSARTILDLAEALRSVSLYICRARSLIFRQSLHELVACPSNKVGSTTFL